VARSASAQRFTNGVQARMPHGLIWPGRKRGDRMALQIRTILGFPGAFDRVRPSRSLSGRLADLAGEPTRTADRTTARTQRRATWPALASARGGVGAALLSAGIYSSALFLLACSALNGAADRLLHGHGRASQVDVLAYGLE
jgi:hypothetical protein